MSEHAKNYKIFDRDVSTVELLNIPGFWVGGGLCLGSEYARVHHIMYLRLG